MLGVEMRGGCNSRVPIRIPNRKYPPIIGSNVDPIKLHEVPTEGRCCFRSAKSADRDGGAGGTVELGNRALWAFEY